MDHQRRGLLARIGVCALNLLAPGLGLLRVGKALAAVCWLLAPFLIVALPIGFIAIVGEPSPAIAGLLFVSMIGALLLLYPGSVVATWCAAREHAAARPWWTRWYAILLCFSAFAGLGQLVPPVARRWYRSFYLPAGSMLPTLAVNDRIWADMRGGRPPKIGGVVLFQLGDQIRVARIAALAGDRFEMRGGVPIVNGRTAVQREAGTFASDDPGAARRFVERLPGETGTHYVLDFEKDGIADNFAEVRIPDGDVFVLGDNRDRAADSRFSHEESGAGMVPVADIRGTPMVLYWSADHSKIGTAPWR